MNKTEHGYTRLDLKMLSGKKHRVISSSEALKDVVPVEWGEDVFAGKKRVIVSKEGVKEEYTHV